MTGKIPVGATVTRAYRFAFMNIVNNLGAIWLPVVLLWVVSLFLFLPLTNATPQIANDPGALLRLAPRFILFGFAALVLVTAQVAPLTKEALGLRTGNAFLQFPFGAATWRLLASYLLLCLAIVAVYVAILIATLIGGLALGLAASSGKGAATTLVVGIVGFLGIVAAFCAIIYIVVRLSFLIAPVVVAERRISLMRAWLLTHGNFWRIFIILLSVVIPFIILDFAYIYAIYGANIFPPVSALGSAQALSGWQTHQQQSALVTMRWSQQHWYIVYPLGLFFGLILYGLFAGISVFAYRSLVPATAEDVPV
jgi:hypothetical protein